jgi:hypothetical protein
MRRFGVIAGCLVWTALVAGTASADEIGIDARIYEGPWSFRVDGDGILTRNLRPNWTNRAGAEVQGLSDNTMLVLLRPSLRYGEIGSGFWAAAKVELGSRNRFFDHQTNGPASGFGVVMGYDGAWIAYGNGYLSDPLSPPIQRDYLSPAAPSHLDGTYAPLRREDPLSTDFLDSGYLWTTMVAQIQQDDLRNVVANPDPVAHGTVSAGVRTDLGSFRVLTDTNGNAFELSWTQSFDRGQVELVAAGVEGARDRWGNTISDRYFGASAGYQLSDQWTVFGRHFFTDGETRANSGWGDGSRQTILSTSYEIIPDHHIYGHSTTTRQFRTNAAATAVVETIDTQVFEFGYFLQVTENLSATLSLNLNDSSSEIGRADTIETVRFSLAMKW